MLKHIPWVIILILAGARQAQPCQHDVSATAGARPRALILPRAVKTPQGACLGACLGASLGALLRPGRLVLFLRQADTAAMPGHCRFRGSDRAGQCNLSTHGRARVPLIGEWLRELGIAAQRPALAGPVLAGPVLRAHDTGKAALGRPRRW